jgi:hypothetical protein
VTGSSPRRAFVGLLAALSLGVACADLPPAPAANAGAAARTGPDESDAWNLVPGTVASLADLDLAALRASPWSRALVTGGFVEDREARLRAFGYDVFNDADRVVIAAIDVAGQEQQIVVVMGRVDGAKAGRAFVEASPGATETRWRDCRIWEGGGRAVGAVGRALVQGTPETVRAAIDAAWGIVPDAGASPLGTLARDLGVTARRPALTLAIAITDEVRARAEGVVEVPPGLRRGAARLDLGADLELEALVILDGAPAAKEAARAWTVALRELSDNRMLRVMGLSPLVEGATVRAEGARVHGRLRIPEAKREGLSERALFLLQAIAKQRSAEPQP